MKREWPTCYRYFTYVLRLLKIEIVNPSMHLQKNGDCVLNDANKGA